MEKHEITILGYLVYFVIVGAIFFLMPYGIMAIVKELLGLDWREHYWSLIQVEMIISWLTNHRDLKT